MSCFICATEEYNQIDKHINAPLFRKCFSLGKKPETAVLTIACLGFYKVYLNGKEITKGILAPYIANPNHYVYYDEYNIKDLLTIGNNVLSVILGNGFQNSNDFGIWNFESASWRSAPKFKCEIIIEDIAVVQSDQTFKCYPSAITFDDFRCGEHFDARQYHADWNLVGFDDSLWQNAIIATPPLGEARLCTVPSIKIEKEIRVKNIIKASNGYIYDFGENNSGVCRLKIAGKNGQEICLTHGEIINNGTLDLSNISFGQRSKVGYVQCDRYLCDGKLSEYTPSFTYHGFQYVLVEGITDEEATDELLTFLVAHSNLGVSGEFSCGDAIVNKIQECTLRSSISNFFYFPTDCPQREKNGWTADAMLSCEQMLYNYDASKSLGEWARNICKAQKNSGALPGIVPTDTWGYAWGNGPAWDGALIELPYRIFTFSGDIQILTDTYEHIYLYIKYLMSKINDNGLIAFGLGDWCEAGTASEELFSTPIEVTDTLTVIGLLQKAEIIFKVLNRMDLKLVASSLRKTLTKNFRKRWINNAMVICKTQTAQAMALFYDVFTNSERADAYRFLIQLIKNKDDHFCVGVIGAKVLFETLSRFGDDKLALKLIVQPSFPSYAYNINRGATTLWEAFHVLTDKADEFKRKDGNERLLSLNHHFWGSVSAWFYKILAGINIVNSSSVLIAPHFIKAVGNVKANHIFPNGDIFVEWKYENDDKLFLSVIAHNINVKIKLPNGYELEKDKSRINSTCKQFRAVGGVGVIASKNHNYRKTFVINEIKPTN